MNGPSDPLAWAKFPRSYAAMEWLREGATKSRALRAIVAEHKRAGVCDENGTLLQRWDGDAWRPAR